MSGSGTIVATPADGSMRVTISIRDDADGVYDVHVDNTACNFHRYQIKYNGDGDWLVNIFVSILEKKIKKIIDDAVAAQMNTLIDNLF